jgi:pimeloyl-ACP methyl ester carboxylesterase
MGFRVLKFDNRDSGISQKFDDVIEDPTSLIESNPYNVSPYCLDDMAADVIAVLDHYKIKRAHILGVGLGGLIAQIAAVRYPTRTRSAAFMMTTCNFTDAQEKPYAQEETFV